MLTVPDRFSRAAAEGTPWNYEDVHAWLARLAGLGFTAEQAVAFLRRCDEVELPPDVMVGILDGGYIDVAGALGLNRSA